MAAEEEEQQVHATEVAVEEQKEGRVERLSSLSSKKFMRWRWMNTSMEKITGTSLDPAKRSNCQSNCKLIVSMSSRTRYSRICSLDAQRLWM